MRRDVSKFDLSPSVMAALGAAILFGASTPFAKILGGSIQPVLLAGLLYLGSGVGLILVRLIRDHGWNNPNLLKSEWGWLFGAICFGGMLGPILLMFGLTQISAANASLLLNLEVVLTAVIAWVVFRENTDKRIILGMFFIVSGGALLSWSHGKSTTGGWVGILAISGACLCWAIDNNLTRKVSATDSLFIAATKGFIAGVVNICIAYQLGNSMPVLSITALTLLCGFLGYGISLLLFIAALRGLGTSRTGAYFSIAPFIGAGIAILFLKDESSIIFWVSALLMGIGIWLHLTENHEHKHIHEAIVHNHQHVYDGHHKQSHGADYASESRHSHLHEHKKLIHSHRHYPDIDHRHTHG